MISLRLPLPLLLLTAAGSILAQTPAPKPKTANSYVAQFVAKLTLFRGAQIFHEAMLKAGNRSELVIHEGGDHGYLMRTQPLYDECLAKTDAFLKSLNLLP